MQFSEILSRIQSESSLSVQESHQAISWFLSGNADTVQMAEFLTRLADRGESTNELIGAAQAMREAMQKVTSAKSPIVDTCGTGGDGSKTFNISTAAALAAAATGVPIAKHGNRKVTSSTGSADVLAELGIDLEAPPELAQRCLDELGICFCFAPFFHPAMKHVGPVRQALGRPTIFNRLGPLSNPALAHCQVLGVGDASLQDKMAKALQSLGTQRSIVVRGNDGVDEISLSAPTRVLEVSAATIKESEWTPKHFGCEPASRELLFADDPASSAECIREVESGIRGPKRDVVVINAAAALWLTQSDKTLSECASIVSQAIDEGLMKKTRVDLGELTHSRS